jgi:hypothetical protein
MKATTALSGAVVAIVAFGALMASSGGMDWPKYHTDSQDRKVTFTVTVGDGKIWAGGFRATYTIGARPTVVVVAALPGTSVGVNSWRITKTVKAGTPVALTAKADWPTKPVTVQMRGPGVDARPLTVISPHEPAIVGTVH